MRNSFTIFYSWQSDIRRNRNLILNSLEKAIKEVQKSRLQEIALEITLDRDTVNKSGSPAISDTIFEKIRRCDIFVCDITIINKSKLIRVLRHRLTSNPNVLIELGLAIQVVGWDRIICVNDTKYSSIEDLPFDIRGHRITSFKSSENNHKDNLTKQLKSAIKYIVENYDKIIAEQQKTSNKLHDLTIYDRIDEICEETTLLDSISSCVNSLHINQLYLDYWDSLQQFYRLSINRFIDNELDELMKVFLQTLNDLDTIVTTYFHFDDKTNSEYLRFLSMKVNGETLTEDEEFEYKQIQTYSPHKEPFRSESWEQADKRIQKLQNELYEQGEKVKGSYKALVMKIKQTLM